jgi:hypothetical protein
MHSSWNYKCDCGASWLPHIGWAKCPMCGKESTEMFDIVEWIAKAMVYHQQKCGSIVPRCFATLSMADSLLYWISGWVDDYLRKRADGETLEHYVLANRDPIDPGGDAMADYQTDVMLAAYAGAVGLGLKTEKEPA